jgi:hypothetical protein
MQEALCPKRAPTACTSSTTALKSVQEKSNAAA